MSDPFDLAVTRSVVHEHVRVLAPVIWVVVALNIATAELFGHVVPAYGYACLLVVLASLTLFTLLLLLRRVPPGWEALVSAAVLWCPVAGIGVGMYIGNPSLLLFLLVSAATTGILLDARWVAKTLVIINLLPLPLLLDGTKQGAFGISALLTASLFACLIHLLMRRSLLREAETARQLAGRIQELEQAHAERVRLQEQLVHSQRMEAVGTLAAGVAHDMNNVLASITNFAELAIEEAPGARSDLEQIIEQAGRGASLTRGLLTFSRRGQYRKQVVQLATVVRELVPLLERTLPRTIELEMRVADDNTYVEGDPAHLTQMLVNLAINAADAMSGTGRLAIELDTVRHGPGGDTTHARVRVTDTGTGMDAATRSRIFEPFFTTKPVGSGTGLGLSMVWGIVHAHHGSIDVASEVGRGTTFTILLPVTDARSRTTAATAPSASPRRATVLAVDDEPSIRESSRRTLVRMGLEVLVASNGAEALEVFTAHERDIDLVLLDMGMPVMGGAECFHLIRKRRPSVPIVVVTGYAAEAEARDLVAAGAVVLEKPCRADALRREVTRLIGTDAVESSP